MIELLRFLITIIIAYFVGKLVSKVKLPSILGWLITGMILGPHAFSLINQKVLDAGWYEVLIPILECTVGLMIGTELVWKKIKQSGKAIIITTLTQSLGTFIIVSLVFGIVLKIMNLPIYLAFIFGGIALATAPAPALSIVREFKTNGPVTKTLIPMAALDDIVGCIVFFTTIAIVAGSISTNNLSPFMIILVVLLPLVIGVITGFITGLILKRQTKNKTSIIILIISILITSAIGFLFNYVILPSPVLNFMLIGMAFSAMFSNMITEKQLAYIMNGFNPILGMAILIVILNLGTPLDYHLILGAGLFTFIYIVSRAVGKYLGAYFGSSITHAPKTVKKYLGLTLLPHSGVSLVFTGIAVSILTGPDKNGANLIQGTIAAAAVINEIVAVIFAKKGFEWSGEIQSQNNPELSQSSIKDAKVITISRQYGSGGHEIGKKLSKKLGIPFYDQKLIEVAAKSSSLDKSLFENYEQNGVGTIRHDLSMEVTSNYSLDDKVFQYQSAIIRKVASEGPCIIIGRCADYILKENKNVIKVFIYADEKNRKQRIEKKYKKDKNLLEKIDKQRIAYYNFYTNQKYGDVCNYDICLDSGFLGIDNCVDIISSIYLTKEKKKAKNQKIVSNNVGTQ